MTDPVPSKEDPCAGQACENTDRHLWPLVSKPDDPYESIHVTKEGNIGINVCGNVIVMSLRAWHAAAGGTPGRAIGDEQRPSKDLLDRLHRFTQDTDFPPPPETLLLVMDAKREIERLSRLAHEPAVNPFDQAKAVFAGKKGDAFLLKMWFDTQEDLDKAFDVVEGPSQPPGDVQS